MTKREARRWIKEWVAKEMVGRISEPPDHLQDSPDPALIESLWEDEVYRLAGRIWPQVATPAETQKKPRP